MAIYDTEEEQLEQLTKWWHNNKTTLIAGVVVAIVIITANNVWRQYQTDKRSQASQLYQTLLQAETDNKSDAIDSAVNQLLSAHRSTPYGHFAALHQAKRLVEKGELDAAKQLLQTEINSPATPELQHVSRLRLIQLLLATKQYEEGLQLIASIDPAKSEGFGARYDELQGDIYVAMDRLDEARAAYQSAQRSGDASPFVQFKLDDIALPAFRQPTSQPAQ